MRRTLLGWVFGGAWRGLCVRGDVEVWWWKLGGVLEIE